MPKEVCGLMDSVNYALFTQEAIRVLPKPFYASEIAITRAIDAEVQAGHFSGAVLLATMHAFTSDGLTWNLTTQPPAQVWKNHGVAMAGLLDSFQRKLDSLEDQLRDQSRDSLKPASLKMQSD
jgi:hypothetical protein